MTNSYRAEARAARPVNRDSFIHEWPEAGLIAFNSPADPPPGVCLECGRVVDLDGNGANDLVVTLDRSGLSGRTNDALAWFRNTNRP